MSELAATRSAVLALADERALMRQGYGFLDEKRMLLAAGLLRELRAHEALRGELLGRLRDAADALRQALMRHGLESLQAYPPGALAGPLQARRQAFLGVALLELEAVPTGSPGAQDAIDASPEAEACAAAFARLLAPLAQLSVRAGNLERLASEYRRTERRARALENVLMPEIEQALAAMQAQLEQVDQEEAVRIRQAARAR